ncbi:efflux RND transporter periplasmic adaptor subunit [Acinetobacter sp. YH16032]|uniref:efflux RND transporter periplasmic adaptor subunit n=1 Tax=Acinetobacter sp. YH16032 TaxID=2601181 RepID=UPI0015D41FB0|nr:efflux RND transporter periplasmic adaptor subunit [Acinetobacter sp. YH16032]
MHILKQRKWWILILLISIGGIYFIFRWWQGPVVETYLIEAKPLIQTVVASGRAENVARSEIGSEISGVVIERRVQEGQRIAAGEVLLIIQSDDLKAQVREAEVALEELQKIRYPQAQVELKTAEFQLQQASREARRRQQTEPGVLSVEEKEQALEAERLARNQLSAAKLKAKSLAPGQVEEKTLSERLNALRAQLAKSEIRAQVSGTILTREVEKGDAIQPGKVLFTVAVDSPTQIKVAVDEQNLPYLKLGQKAEVIADAYPEQAFPAEVNFIAPNIDPQRGTVEVKLAVNSVPNFLKQDMTVSVNVETARRNKTKVIANDALIDPSTKQAEVMVIREGKVQRQSVKLGLRGTTMTEILSGLDHNDQVVIKPDQVKPDQRVRTKQVQAL